MLKPKNWVSSTKPFYFSTGTPSNNNGYLSQLADLASVTLAEGLPAGSQVGNNSSFLMHVSSFSLSQFYRARIKGFD